MNQECLSIFVASSAYLFLKMFSNSLIQGYARFRSKNFKYVEDQKFFAKSDEPPKPQTDLQNRADAAWRNDLENIPVFFVAALCALMTGINPLTYKLLVTVFCLARTMHTFTLIFPLQPWRTMAFSAGIGCTGLLFRFSLTALGM
jgi:uncharacterized MAPEG superfamily protein